MSGYRPGDLVQTRFGKGTVREVRNHGRLLVDVRGHAMVIAASEITPAAERSRRAASTRRGPDGPSDAWHDTRPGQAASEIDLHGHTVEQALGRVESALNDALLADLPELRVIHGQSGGRLRRALHRWLATIPAVRTFRLDPRNEGVTIVKL